MNKLFYRFFELERAALDEEKRELTLSFSSEMPVERWFGAEVLLHGEKNVELGRLRATGSLLYHHNPEDIRNVLGPVKRVWLDGRRGYALVGFDEDEDAERAMKKVRSKSLRGVSFAYVINKARRLQEKEEWTDEETGKKYTGPAIVGTRWEPYEITLTPTPADPTVGPGREAPRSLEGIEIIETRSNPTNQEEQQMDKEQIMQMIRDALASELPALTQQLRDALAAEGRPQFAVEASVLAEILGRATAAGGAELKGKIMDMALEGRSEPELLRAVVEGIRPPDAQDTSGSPPPGTPPAGIPTLGDMPDEEFARMICEPSMFRLQ
jgi:hypothetical protein